MRRAMLAVLFFLFSTGSVLLSVKYIPFFAPTVSEQSSALKPIDREQLPTLAPIIKKVLPAVVGIKTTKFEENVLHGGIEEKPGAGSGFIIDPRGLVVTAHHVIADVQLIEVIFNDEKRALAEIVGSDDTLDVALLKIVSDRKDFSVVSFGDSDIVEVGDFVFAIGNQFGTFSNSVNAGIISAKRWGLEMPMSDRRFMEVQMPYLQTDAPINSGNSGGPLFNLHGQVIGLNIAIFSFSRGNAGLGFATSSNLVKHVARELETYHRFRRAWPGFAGTTVITEENAVSLGVHVTYGLLVKGLFPGGPAEKSGFKPDDIILSWNGKEIRTREDIEMAIFLSPVGETAAIKVLRNGKTIELPLLIKEAGKP